MAERRRKTPPALQSIFDRRIILVSGKGGVGRTTVAAGLALTASRAGKRTLLLEIGDPEGGDSPLATLYGRERFRSEIAELAVRLKAAHLWAPKGHELFLKDLIPGGALLGAAIRSKALQTFLQAAPSFMEMGWFYHLLTLIRARDKSGEPEHEFIVLDLPATGHTLALTGLPNLLHRLLRGGPITNALQEGQRYIHDPELSAAWVVTLPEQLPVSESLDLLEGLRSDGVPVGGVVVNKIPFDPFTADERESLEELLEANPALGSLDFHRQARAQRAEERLREQTDLPIVRLPELRVTGEALLSAIATEMQVAQGPAS